MTNMLRSCASLLAITLGLFCASYAYSGVVLNRSIVIFNDATQTRQDIVVSNDSDTSRLFVSVEPFLVDQPGTDEQELLSLDLDVDPMLLVTPNKLLLEPGGSATVRMLNMAEPEDVERYYRVNVTPMQKPIDFEREEGDSEEDSAVQISIALAYQALVIVPPSEPTSTPQFTRAGKILTFTNTGNSFYLLRDGVQCNPKDTDDCVDLVSKRIYPGNEYTVELPFDGPAQYMSKTLAGSKAFSIL